MPDEITVLVSSCGDSFACSWSETFSREKNCYVSRPEFDIGPTVEEELLKALNYYLENDAFMEFYH